MRKLLFFAFGAAVSVQLAMAQEGGGRGGRGGRGGPPPPPPGPPPAGLECFEGIPMPEFPKAALQAKVDGTVWLNIAVGPQGAVGKVDTQVTSAWADGAKLLTPPAEAAIHSSKIKADCAGKHVLIVFRYELHGEPTANPKVTVEKDSQYMVRIDSQPMTAPGAGKK
jgi:hypothetical protein